MNRRISDAAYLFGLLVCLVAALALAWLEGDLGYDERNDWE